MINIPCCIWLIHVNVWQKPLQYCKVISLQLIKINEKKIEYTLRIISQIKKQKFSSTGDVLILPSGRYQCNGQPRVIATLPSKSREHGQLRRVQGTAERGVCFSLNFLFYTEVLYCWSCSLLQLFLCIPLCPRLTEPMAGKARAKRLEENARSCRNSRNCRCNYCLPVGTA